jgi:hypothetical protein
MSRFDHVRCGYSQLAPGCDDVDCLLHRIRVAEVRGWDASPLRTRLDAALDRDLALLLVEASREIDLRDADRG